MTNGIAQRNGEMTFEKCYMVDVRNECFFYPLNWITSWKWAQKFCSDNSGDLVKINVALVRAHTQRYFSLINSFCRAMLCISAAYAVMRYLSVRLSHSWIMSKRISVSYKFFSPSGRPIILVFLCHPAQLCSDGDPSNGVVE